MSSSFNAGTMAALISAALSQPGAQKKIEECEEEKKERKQCCPRHPENKDRQKCFLCFIVQQCDLFGYKTNTEKHCCNGDLWAPTKEKLGEGAHHLLPSAMLQIGTKTVGAKKEPVYMDGYDEDTAMTICVLGYAKNYLHGACHISLRLRLQEQIKNKEDDKCDDEGNESIVECQKKEKREACYKELQNKDKCKEMNYYTRKHEKLVDICIKSIVEILPHCKGHFDEQKETMYKYYEKYGGDTKESCGIKLHSGYSSKPEKYFDDEKYKHKMEEYKNKMNRREKQWQNEYHNKGYPVPLVTE